MNSEFRANVISPVDCMKTGWAKIKDQYWLLLGITIVGFIVGSIVPMGIILGPMMCGIHMCYLRAMRRQPVAFDLLFKGFDFFVPSLLVTLVQVVPAIIGAIVMYVGIFVVILGIAAMQTPELAILIPILMVLLVLGFVLVMVLIQMFFIFAYQLVADRRMDAMAAIKTSFNGVKANLGGMVGLMLLNFGLGILGVLACYIGAFFVLPITFAAIDEAYERIFPSQPVAGQIPYQQPQAGYSPPFT